MSVARFLRSLYERVVRPLVPHDVKTTARARLWLPVARAIGYPISSPLRPRPPLPRHRPRMRIGRVLMACDLNREYLGYWPWTRRAWLEMVGIEPLLVLIADEHEIPPDLRDDEYVVSFAPIDGVHTALQAQCVRLLYPAVVHTPDAVLVSDIDLYPLRASYFLEPVEALDARHFVSYRDVYLDREMVSMLFNAALPDTWSEIFDVTTIDDVRSTLETWTSGLEYDGRRAWPGWYTDQRLLYEALTRWPEASQRWWVMDDEFTRYRQLDRLELEREDGLSQARIEDLRRLEYSDYVCLFPYDDHRQINDLVLRLGLEAASG